MTPNGRIGKELVEALPLGATAWDSEVRGFGVRRQRRDAFYIVKFRDKDGRQRVITIGRHGRSAWMPERARNEAIRIRGLERDGRDPASARDQDKVTPTLAAFIDRYIREYATPHKKPRTTIEDERRLKLYILPAIGRVKLRDLGRADVARLHASLRAKPVAANRTIALLSAILTWAERVGERPDGSNPCRHVDRYPEKARERLLTAPELARLGDALDRAAEGWTDATASAPSRTTPEDQRAIAAIRLLIFTGARVTEILTLQWDWIDVAQGTARLPDSKTAGQQDGSTNNLPPARRLGGSGWTAANGRQSSRSAG
jgi:hypothetical protein